MSHSTNKNLTVINFFPGPGVGKSTLALGLAHTMKIEGYNCEYVPEIAKELVFDNRRDMFFEQDFILAEQNNRLRRLLRGGVEYAVVDGPLLLSHFYSGVHFPISFHQWVDYIFNSYTNINFLVERKHAYNPHGRNETVEQSDSINKEIEQYLAGHGINYTKVPSYIKPSDLLQLVKFHIEHK